jgi:ABC-type branched-subunit amino acid transport system ATPase component
MTDKRDAILSVKNVTKTFEGIHALEDVSFDVKPGHIKALIGPNGAGKTTLLNAINGIMPPDSDIFIFLTMTWLAIALTRLPALVFQGPFSLSGCLQSTMPLFSTMYFLVPIYS